jgi:hypothetical protein
MSEAFRLLGRSKKEAGIYLAAFIAESWLYVFMCGVLGVEGAYAGFGAVKENLLMGLLAYLPGILFLSWFAAGLGGRLIMHAVKGEADGLVKYANGWFLRKAGWELFFVCLMWLPMWLLPLKFTGVAFVALAIMLSFLWFSLRVSFWLNFSVSQELGLVEALGRSYALTRGRVGTLILLGGLPMLAAKSLSWAIVKAASAQGGAEYYVKALFEGTAGMVVMAAYAAAYLKLKEAGPAAEPAAEVK